MSYRQTLQAVDSEKALQLLGLSYEQQGGYLSFECPNCANGAKLKMYGETKNLYYCTSCKAGGNIVVLTMENKKIPWGDALLLLAEKAVSVSAKKIVEELNLEYELVYDPFIEKLGITKNMAFVYGIGVPKGKTMLAGCVAFTVKDEVGMKVAYYGLRMKDMRPVFHKSFNPEYYLYNLNNIDKNEIVYFTTDIVECVLKLQSGVPAICNFGLPYISSPQLIYLEDFERVVFKVKGELVNSMAVQLAQYHKRFFQFEH